jgi:hypothetical protein
MKEFMMIFRFEKMEGDTTPTAEQMQAVLKQWKNWISEIAKQGKYSGTNRLLPEGKTIRPGKVISDGPYMEVKEMIGGYLIVKADSMDEAMKMADGCPNLLYGGNVEVRAVMNIEYDFTSEKFLEPKAQS